MDDVLFPEKLQLLQLYYPDYLDVALGELLRGCNGDVEATRGLLEGPRPIKRLGLHQSSLGRHVKPKLPERTEGDHKNVKREHEGQVSPKGTAVSQNDSCSLTLPLSPSKITNRLNPRNKSAIITLNTPEDVDKHLSSYASLYPNFFAKDVADRLLDDVLAQKDHYINHKFYLFGNHCVLNHGFASFGKPDADYADLIYNGLKSRKPMPYSKVFSETVEIIDDFVNDVVIPQTKRLPFQRTDRWSGTYCAVNYYEKLQNNLEWHSDRLSHIGPHNFIASISLGSTRLFRLRSNRSKHAPIYQIPLPHNSLLVMKPGCQEEFKHCVNSMSKSLEVHPKIGTMRFGLTYRYYAHDFLANIPKCKCNMSMTLRRSYKTPATRGRYFWLCENLYQNRDCGSFHWADFSNAKEHYVAKDTENISTWIADDDIEGKKISNK